MNSDLYGSTSNDLHAVKSAVEEAVGCTLLAHESSYTSGDYYRADLMNGENIIVKLNLDPIDGKPAESKFPHYPSLMYINNTVRSSELRSALSKQKIPITLLRHK